MADGYSESFAATVRRSGAGSSHALPIA